MKTTPINITVGLSNIERLSSAPLRTKKSILSGAVHLSTLSISSWLVSHMLQKTVPVIIQTRRSENLIVNRPATLNSFIEKPTVKNTNATARARRLLREWKKRSR